MGNTKFKIKQTILIALVILACLFTGLGVKALTAKQASAAVIELTDSSIPDRAVLNSEISLPESVSVSYDGKDHTAASGVVACPDGKIVNASELTKLDQTGVYSVKYFFKASGVKHTVLKQITVYTSYYSLSSGTSEIKYATAGDPLWSGKNGVIIGLTEGDTFTYNKPVDLKAAGEDGLTEVIEIDARLGSDETGKYVADAEAVWVRLTDCYNPNVYAELRIGRSPDYGGNFFPGVRTSNQPCNGLQKGTKHGSTKQVVLDGVQYGFWPNEVGYMSGFNAMGSMTTGYTWKYDYEKMRFYFCYDGGDDIIVTDLDEPLLFTDGNFFPGWTTGEVYVSLYADNFIYGSVARTELISVAGENVQDLGILTGNYTDEVAPAITINAKKTTATGIYGAIGDTITIPEASATDVNLLGGVEVTVYTGYGTQSASNVSVTDGKFKITEKDTYTIVYTARDGAGNVGTEIYTVAATAAASDRAITLEYDQLSSLSAGLPVVLSGEVTQSLNSDIDDVTVSIHIESSRQSGDYKVGDTFIPGYAEKYRITYSYTDGIYSYQKSYSVDCAASNLVTFDGEVVLPQTFIKGYHYSIPAAKAYTYASGAPELATVSAYAVFDGGAETLISDINDVVITGSKKVKFVFKAEGAENVVTDEVSIVDAAYDSSSTDASKFFVGNFTADDSKLKFTSNVTSGNNKLSFINAVSARTFGLTYKVLIGENNFETLRITLTDYANSSIKNVIDINKGNGTSTVSINGGTATELSKFNFASDMTIDVSYTYATRKLIVGGNNFALDANYPSGKCYLSIEMLGISGTSAIEINAINNQPFTGRKLSNDIASPEIYVNNCQGEYKKGSVVTTPIPEFNDVISGVNYSTISFTITAADNKPVKDANGNVLSNLDYTKQYDILLDRIAKFYVRYTVSDFAGNYSTTAILLECADTTAPVITLTNMNEGGTIHVKPTDTIKICFTVKDDCTSEGNLVTYIHLHCDDMYSFVQNVTGITDDNRPSDGVFEAKFNIDIKGNYTAQIHCYDEKGNHSVVRIKIVVE